ncbi:MAG: NAD(P)/FAD-dependent oxidoreductase [Candidatus Omnitrophota bacterium]|jgi:prolycopene isomerase
MKKYDVIIIGAGIGGLTAGAILAKNGKKVLILEKNPVAGGYVVNFRREGFKFDATLHVINGCQEGGLTYKVLKEAGVHTKLDFIKPKFNSRLIYPDMDLSIPQCNLPEYLSLLIGKFPKESIGIKNIIKTMIRIYDDVQKLYHSNISLKVQVLYFPIKYPYLFSYKDKTVEQLFNKFIKDEKLKTVMAQSWLYFGLPISKLSAIFFSYAWYDFLNNGVFFPKGGSGSLVRALSDSIVENGGSILFNSEVKSLSIKNLEVTSVNTKENEDFACSIISNLDPNQTFLSLIKNNILPRHFLALVKGSNISSSAITIYAGLKETNFSDFSDDYEIFLSNNYGTENQFESCINNDPNKVTFSLGLHYNLKDSTFSKEDRVISISTSSAYDTWARLSRDNYEDKKRRYSETILLRLKKYMPNLYNNISLVNVSTPLTLERYTKNMQGATYGLSQITRQSGLKRMPQTTPIRNLFLSGAWTQPGGGICGVMLSGMHAAGAILDKNFYTESIDNQHLSSLLNKINKT